jgi:uncharacterized membrane protein required for colicin V production
MWIDALVIVIMIFSIARAFHNGFVYTVMNAAGWLVSAAAAVALYPLIINVLSTRSAAYEALKNGVIKRFQTHLDAQIGNIMDGVPDTLKSIVDTIIDTLSVSLAGGIASVCFSVATFVILLLAFKLVSALIICLFSKRFHRGVIRFVDGLSGLAAGAVIGMFRVFVVLALIMPLSLLISKDANVFVSDSLFSSIFAGDLYDNNLLLLILNDFLKFW